MSFRIESEKSQTLVILSVSEISTKKVKTYFALMDTSAKASV